VAALMVLRSRPPFFFHGARPLRARPPMGPQVDVLRRACSFFHLFRDFWGRRLFTCWARLTNLRALFVEIWPAFRSPRPICSAPCWRLLSYALQGCPVGPPPRTSSVRFFATRVFWREDLFWRALPICSFSSERPPTLKKSIRSKGQKPL